MANNIIRRVWNQNRMVNIEDLYGAAFQAESGGHTFEISGIDDTGAAVELSGTVSGVFRRPDNADIALTGSASDGVVSVTLSEDCYAVPGRFGLTIFVTSNSQKVAVYACVGTVSVSSTGNVAGDTPASVEDLIDDINAAIADLNNAIGSIPADYSQFMAAIAPAYSSSALYAVGSYAWYNGSLYRCTTAITTAEAWTAAHWTAAVLGDDVGDLKSAISEKTYNLISGIRENQTVGSNGKFVSNSGTNMYIAPAETGKTYTVKTNDGSGLVCAFFETDPMQRGVQSYNSSRTIQTTKTITAPVTGWIAFRAPSTYTEPQIVEGSEDKPYIKPITATDYVARQSIASVEPDIADSKAKINAVITTKPVYQDITEYTITDNAYKQFGDGSDSPSTAWEYATLPVSQGEEYIIACFAGQWAKPWIVLNSNNSVIARSDLPTSVPVAQVTENVTIPQNGAYLVINNRKADMEIYIGKKTGEQYIVDGDSVYIDGKDLQSALEAENISNILYGKVLCCCGDSITYGDDMDTEGITNESNVTVYQSDASGDFTETTSGFRKTWNWQIASRNHMTLYNAGVNGSTMQGISEKNGFSLANGRYTKLPDNIDYLLIWFGWNDTAYGTLGAITDTTNESYYGGYNVVLPYLINKYPYSKIGLIVPFGCDADHRNAIRLLGNKWGVAVWDNYQGGTPLYYGKESDVGVNAAVVTANQAKFQANGAHPNYKGHRELGAMIEHWMRGL